MPPPTSKRETILTYLVEMLFPTMTAGATYNFTPGKIARGIQPLNTLDDSDFPVVFVADTKEARRALTGNQFRSTLSVTIVGAIKSSDGVSGNQKRMDKLVADITKVLETDRTLGNRVYTTTVSQIETDAGDVDPYTGCAITVDIDYGTEGTNP